MNLLVKTPLRFSLIAIFFVVLMFFIIILLDKNPVIYTSNIIFIGPMLSAFLFLSIKSFKDSNPDGLRFWQGVSIGFIYTINFTVLFALFLWVYANVFDQVYFDEYRMMIIEKIEEGKAMLVEKLGEEGYREYLRAGESTNERIIWSLAFNNILIGFLVTPLISLFMRTTDTQKSNLN